MAESHPFLGSRSINLMNEPESSAMRSCFPCFGTAGPKELPRKIPMRIEPKVFFANERTFLSWLHMSVTIGSIASAILAFATDPNLSKSSAQLMAFVGILLLPVAIIFATYATWTFNERAVKLRLREEGPFDDRRGPIALAAVMFCALGGIFAMSVIKLLL